ncbi:MAG: ABC transporter permease [Lachnospiraceae bacterium]|nr:ABC transporter permease [Lachnospiraceae bacterium]
MWRNIFKKDIRMLVSGRFFLMSLGFLVLYTLYVNFGYVKFMNARLYNVYLYDPDKTQTTVSASVQRVSSKETLDAILLDDTNGVGIDAGTGTPRLIFYETTENADRHRADYALSLLQPSGHYSAKIIGTNTPKQKARKEITCELLFFEIAAVGFLGIAAVLFKEKNMGVIRVHAILPLRKNLFILSKLAIFLLSDLVFAILLTALNVGMRDTASILPAVLFQTTLLSLIMALTGLICALLLKDFRQFTLAYLLIAVFVATPVFLSANTAIKPDWIRFHPFYHIYMGLKNAYFGTPMNSPGCCLGCLAAIAVLFAGVQCAFRREMRKEG